MIPRVLVFWIGYYAIIVAVGLLKGMAPPRARDLLWGGISALLVLGWTLLLLRREKRSTESIGLRFTSTSLLRMAAGAGIGLALYGAYLFALTTLSGGFTFTRNPETGSSVILLMICTYLALSSMEELGYRGYALRSLVPSIGLWPAQIVVAIAFAANHLFYGWSWISVLLGVTTGALLFGMAAVASGGLALPIGLHAAWNLSSWASGERSANGIWRMNVDAMSLDRTSMIGSSCYVVAMLAGTAGFWLWYRRRLRVQAPPR